MTRVLTLPTRAPRPASEDPGGLWVAALDDLRELPVDAFVAALAREAAADARVLAYHGRPDGPDAVVLTAALVRPGGLAVLRGRAPRGRPLPALGAVLPRLFAHERELARACDLELGPPPTPRRTAAWDEPPDPSNMYFWTCPIRHVDPPPDLTGAQAIDRGPFRLACRGDRVLAIELRLGARRRGAEALLRARPLSQLPGLVETLVGDTSVAHAWAHARAIEGLAGVAPTLACEAHRAVGLELERIALHLAALAGTALEIGYTPGAAALDRLHAAIRDLTQRLCGSRYGRRWVRPGGAPGLDVAARADLRATLEAFGGAFLSARVALLSAGAVRDRLDAVGVVPRDRAAELGLVGPAGRASGGAFDLRVALPGALHRRLPIAAIVETDGDCLARASVRAREVQASLAWLLGALDHAAPDAAPVALDRLAPRHLAIAAVEGARGPVVHTVETDDAGRILSYRALDPSLVGWPGLFAAARDGARADFDLCCRSFGLSLAGSEL